MKNGDIVEIDGKKYKLIYIADLDQYTLIRCKDDVDNIKSNNLDDDFEKLKSRITEALNIFNINEMFPNDIGVDIKFSGSNKSTVMDKIKGYFKTPTDEERYGKINRYNTIKALHDRIDRLEKMLEHIMSLVKLYGN